MTVEASPEQQSRFLIGIDLGTTNSAVAYVDTAQKQWKVRDLPIPQLVAPGEVEARDTLPSFHYESAAGEFSPGALRLPWSREDPAHVVGLMAREHGAAVPGRLIVSAKSWLSHSGVDRTAALLPWHGATDVQRLSPVQVSARYLLHLRQAWDHRFSEHPMARQEIVLCVPASFDEVARELTVEAAKAAGLPDVVLLEEPQAAFYAWIYSQGRNWDQRVKPRQRILVCDIGGGTTDFTLIQVRPAKESKVLFHRIAVGEHLMLGGDNLDLAIAHHIEQKIAGGQKLQTRQWGALVRSCRQIKETLLGRQAPDRAVIHVAAGGSKLIGGSMQVEVKRDEIEQLLLEGFLPRGTLEEKPLSRRSGFQEFGLPYAPDPAITKYLAAFLLAHRDAGLEEGHTPRNRHDPARPDLVLFNGGLFESPVLRGRLFEVMSSWFKTEAKRPWKPQVLEAERLDLAVARGAAYFGMVRRGRGERITGGLGRSYYIGIDTTTSRAASASDAAEQAICLLPAGIEEGQSVELADRTFNLLIRQPVQFPLYASSTRTADPPGTIISVDPEQLKQLPSIHTVLQSGRKGEAETVSVRLGARLTEIGTLDIWCAEAKGERQWRLQFDVRAAIGVNGHGQLRAAEEQGVVDQSLIDASRRIIIETFTRGSAQRPESLVRRLEESTGMGRNDWPSSLMRGMWQAMMEAEPGRRISDVHEARWLNLSGFCLRPGYGLAADDWRVGQIWKLFAAGICFVRNELCRAEWQILWRRVAGGLMAGQQQVLADPLIADWRNWFRKSGQNVKGRSPAFQFGPHETAEAWRLLGSLELLPFPAKLELGNMLLERLSRETLGNVRDALLFAIGRVGARVPVYCPLNEVVAAESAAQWAGRLIELNPKEGKAAFALVQLIRMTGDRYRDVSDEMRRQSIDWLTARNAPAHYLQLTRQGGTLESEEQKIVFGETLPRGLRIE